MRVEVAGLGKRYGDVHALQGVSCEIPAGRRVALVGPNGSGKSTFNRVLMGLLSFEGDVRLDGHSPREDRIEIARRMAYVPQHPPNLAAPVRELVRALARVRNMPPERVGRVCERLDLDLEAVATRPFRGLSGGMKQKLLVAFALAAEASLLILDEPTGSLDPHSRERFLPLLGELAGPATVLLCSHRLEEVQPLVDHVLMLEEGQLAYDGPAAAFLDTSTRGIVDVTVTDAAAEHWLAERGFRSTQPGRWVRVVRRADKRDLLAALMKDLAASVVDVTVRDLEWLELDDEVGHGDR